MTELVRLPWAVLAVLLSPLLAFACAADPVAPGAPKRSALVPAPGSPFVVGSEPADLAIGDMDGDGDLDLVVAESAEAQVVVLPGDGRGGFGEPRRTALPEGSDPHLVAVGDLDGDGVPDAAVSSHDSNRVTFLRGEGDGGFAPFPGSPVPTGSPEPPHNHALALADLDRDGDLDLLFGNQDAGSLAVLLGDGQGAFAPAPDSPVSTGPSPYPVATGDLDGDGVLDLAVADLRARGVTLLRGDGRGGFSPFPSSPLPTPRSPFHVALADLDGDGRLDLVASHNDSPLLSVHLGDGEGGFREAPAPEIGSGAWKLGIADLDGDGHLDLAGGTRENRVQLLLGRGDGTFRRGPALETGDGPWTVEAADLDGDGSSDLVALGSGDGTVSVWLQR